MGLSSYTRREFRQHRPEVFGCYQGKSARKFEQKYSQALEVKRVLRRYRRVLVVDDVATEGSTLRCAFQAMRAVSPECEIVAATAGLMVVKAVVRRWAGLVS